jgi:hypothetical protein
MKRLHAAGARQPQPMTPVAAVTLANLADSVNKGVPMIHVPDIASTLEWYKSIGFKELGRYEDAGQVNFGMVSFGKAELMLNAGGERGPQRVSLWFYTDRVGDLYQALKARQMQAAQAALAGEPVDENGIEFVEEIYDAFYGAREFGIRDLNGYNLFFIQPAASPPEIG